MNMFDYPVWPCRRPGCAAMVSKKRYACTSHWFKLPKDLQLLANEGLKRGNARLLLSVHNQALAYWKSGRGGDLWQESGTDLPDRPAPSAPAVAPLPPIVGEALASMKVGNAKLWPEPAELDRVHKIVTGASRKPLAITRLQ